MIDADEDSGERSIFDLLRSALGEAVARDVAQELYGLGYCIERRKGDLFDLAKAPPGVSYQWMETGEVQAAAVTGWLPVSASRHEGLYAPIGFDGPIELRGMTLVERPQTSTDLARLRDVAQAEHNEFLWRKKYAGFFSGSVKVGTSEETAQTHVIGDAALAEQVVTHTRLSFNIDSAGAMFAERDRLRQLAAECGDIMPSAAEITAQAVSNTKEAAQ